MLNILENNVAIHSRCGGWDVQLLSGCFCITVCHGNKL